MNIPDVTIRSAEAADSAGIARVHVDSWRETYAGLVPDRFFGADALAARERMWASILSRDPLPGTVVVADRAGQIVGFAFAGSADHPDATKGLEPARNLHLFSIYLIANDHGAGLGRQLLHAAIGDRPAQLWVAQSNERAREFYARQGFATDGVEISDPDIDGLVQIRMVR